MNKLIESSAFHLLSNPIGEPNKRLTSRTGDERDPTKPGLKLVTKKREPYPTLECFVRSLISLDSYLLGQEPAKKIVLCMNGHRKLYTLVGNQPPQDLETPPWSEQWNPRKLSHWSFSEASKIGFILGPGSYNWLDVDLNSMKQITLSSDSTEGGSISYPKIIKLPLWTKARAK